MHAPKSKQRAVGICLILGSILVLAAVWDWDIPEGPSQEAKPK
jgi:hypothetical protein